MYVWNLRTCPSAPPALLPDALAPPLKENLPAPFPSSCLPRFRQLVGPIPQIRMCHVLSNVFCIIIFLRAIIFLQTHVLHAHTNMRARTLSNTRTHTHKHTHTYFHTHLHAHADTHTHMYMCTYTHMLTRPNTLSHTQTHIHTHTHTSNVRS